MTTATTTTAPQFATRQIKEGFTAAIHEIDATKTIRDQANEIFNELLHEDSWLIEGTNDDYRVVWFKLQDGKGGALKGIGVQRYGHALMLSPGFFNEQGELLTYGLEGTDFLGLDDYNPEKVIAQVIRRARKLEVR